MGQVAEIAEHTGILDSAPLAGLVGLVGAVGADKGEDPLEDGGRQFEPGCEDVALLGSIIVVLVVAGVVHAVLVALDVVVGSRRFLGRL